jgi:ribosomal protein L33
MKLKIDKKTIEVSPFCISSMMSYGSIKFECPNCHHYINLSYTRVGDKLEYAKYCPFCGSECDLSDVFPPEEKQ